MTPHRTPRRFRRRGRHPDLGSPRGFTLVELMVVIVIVALLVALLLPAIWGAVITAREGQVRTDISELEKSITAFQAEYGGIAPPSRITLYKAGETWDSRSRAIIRRIWPQFDFSNSGGLSLSNDSVTLTGAECLVFFLGGIPVEDGSGRFRATGFSKNPANPFASETTAANRVGPFFAFESNRLVDEHGNSNGFPEYLDALPGQTNPYIYLSSYDGRGYRTADIPTGTLTRWYVLPDDTTANDTDNPPYKPNGYQIISPGGDGLYGDGGVYDPDNTSSLTAAELDNITNFTDGRLAPQ